MKALRKNAAFTFVELLIIICVVGCLAVVLLPEFERRNRRTCCQLNCVNNLKQIALAFKLWSGDNANYPMRVSVTNGGTMELIKDGDVFVHFRVLSNELSTPKVLFCPQETDPKNNLQRPLLKRSPLSAREQFRSQATPT